MLQTHIELRKLGTHKFNDSRTKRLDGIDLSNKVTYACPQIINPTLKAFMFAPVLFIPRRKRLGENIGNDAFKLSQPNGAILISIGGIIFGRLFVRIKKFVQIIGLSVNAIFFRFIKRFERLWLILCARLTPLAINTLRTIALNNVIMCVIDLMRTKRSSY